MADVGLSRAGMQYVASNVRIWDNNEWPESGHDLDRVFLFRGRHFGIEVKNTLAYIEREEFETKWTMCKYFGFVPLFVVRFAPQTWIQELDASGGFVWVMEYQLYPHGEEAFAQEVKSVLGLKVDAPRTLWEGTIQRLRNWLERKFPV